MRCFFQCMSDVFMSNERCSGHWNILSGRHHFLMIFVSFIGLNDWCQIHWAHDWHAVHFEMKSCAFIDFICQWMMSYSFTMTQIHCNFGLTMNSIVIVHFFAEIHCTPTHWCDKVERPQVWCGWGGCGSQVKPDQAQCCDAQGGFGDRAFVACRHKDKVGILWLFHHVLNQRMIVFDVLLRSNHPQYRPRCAR